MIVLSSLPYQERDRIVSGMSREWGRVSFLARGAQNSRDRFGAFLQPFSWVQAQAKAPRASSGLWHLERVDPLGDFAGLRRGYRQLEVASLATRLVRDFVPEGVQDVRVFELLSEFLRCLEQVPVAQLYREAASFWSEFSEMNGFDRLEELTPSSIPRQHLSLLYARWTEKTQQPWDYFLKWYECTV